MCTCTEEQVNLSFKDAYQTLVKRGHLCKGQPADERCIQIQTRTDVLREETAPVGSFCVESRCPRLEFLLSKIRAAAADRRLNNDGLGVDPSLWLH